MATNQMRKYVWLIDTIHRANRISFEDINRKWLMDDISEGVEIPKRTFHKWCNAVYEVFGIMIENEKCGEFRYYIHNRHEIRSNAIKRWLLDTVSTSNLVLNNQNMHDRILLEDIPSGREFLNDIINAMKMSCQIQFTYHNYWRGDYRQNQVEPYCVKLFHQRWYLVGRIAGKDLILVYSLDRMSDFCLLDSTFEYPNDFSPEQFFEECFGVVTGDGSKPVRIRVRATAGQANYLRALPWHHTQREVERGEGISVFELKMRPTFDFEQEILMLGESVEVLEPKSLRNKIIDRIENMRSLYR